MDAEAHPLRRQFGFETSDFVAPLCKDNNAIHFPAELGKTDPGEIRQRALCGLDSMAFDGLLGLVVFDQHIIVVMVRANSQHRIASPSAGAMGRDPILQSASSSVIGIDEPLSARHRGHSGLSAV